MFYIFHYRNYYCLDDKVELRERPLKCSRLGVTTRSVPACTVGNTEQYSRCTYNVTLRCVPATIVALERLLRILSFCLYPYVSSLQCACAILSSVSCPAVQHFSTLSRKRYDFRKKKKVTEHKMCVWVFLCTLSNIFSFLEKMSEIWSKMYICLHVKFSLFLSDINLSNPTGHVMH